LLDTHVLLCWLADSPALAHGAREVFASTDNTIFVSSINIWEIAIKSALGKLDADVDEIRASLEPSGLQTLPFNVDDAAAIVALPAIHRDPFDRALVAQARCNRLRLLTTDERLAAYGEDIVRV
jgi:PIN domain nuclease of toxin-antitoxin system